MTGYPRNTLLLFIVVVSRCSHLGCVSRRFDCIQLIFIRREGPLVTRNRVAWQRVDANPRLKINRIIHFSCIQMLFTAFDFSILRLFKLKTEGQTILTENVIAMLQNSSKFSLILGKPNRTLNKPAQEPLFQAWLNLNISHAMPGLKFNGIISPKSYTKILGRRRPVFTSRNLANPEIQSGYYRTVPRAQLALTKIGGRRLWGRE